MIHTLSPGWNPSVIAARRAERDLLPAIAARALVERRRMRISFSEQSGRRE
jgi:hypothetical protein